MPPKFEIWTSEAEKALIDFVEMRPILWDVTNKYYRRNDLKELQWEEFCKRMGVSYTGKQNNVYYLSINCKVNINNNNLVNYIYF
ncbi:hypothetical protein X777_15534 [Ooceraea biroi]|uniref:MADF domain-containing protein n=1 Tax=Ooceraea biroi TaxID=2015173 RepID=A0A026X3T7_OOCBI|nr:hypothetical protein X777_15534 [Ooceraea biroi]